MRFLWPSKCRSGNKAHKKSILVDFWKLLSKLHFKGWGKVKKKSIMLNIIEIFKVLGYRPENAGPLALKMQVAYFLI